MVNAEGLQLVEDVTGLSSESLSLQEGTTLTQRADALARAGGLRAGDGAHAQEWMSRVCEDGSLSRGGAIMPEASIAELDAALKGRTYLLGQCLSLPDLLVFPLVARSIAKLPHTRQREFVHAFRTIERPAFYPSSSSSEPQQPLASAKETSTKRTSSVKGSGSTIQPKQQQQQQQSIGGYRQQQKQQSQASSSSTPAASAPSGGFLDLRCAEIKSVEPHSEADSLWVLSVDLGEEKERQIVSGLRKAKTQKQLQGALVLVWSNLKPSNLKGMRSEGLVLCASNDNQTELVKPPSGATAGERIVVSGCKNSEAPTVSINPKKKEHEKYLLHFATDASGTVMYANASLVDATSGSALCTTPLANARVQ
jgi:methionine--tRNA ligase beta chain